MGLFKSAATSSPDAESPEGEVKAGTAPVPNGFRGFLHRRGYEWLGFDAPAITKPDSLVIHKVKLAKSPPKNCPLAHCIEAEPLTIDSLRLVFPRYVLVRDVALTDAYQATFLVLATIVLVRPYHTWYGLGGKAYDAIDTMIRAVVRIKGQQYSLDRLYREGGATKLEMEIQGSTDGGPVLDFTEQLGVVVTQLKVERWEDNAPEAYRDGIRAKSIEQQIRERKVQQLETERVTKEKSIEVVDVEGKVLDAERKRLEKVKLNNAVLVEGFRELAADNPEALKQLQLLEGLGPEQYEQYLRNQAIRETGIKVLGGSALDLLGLGKSKDHKDATDSTTHSH